jgi:hypothetical protein
MDRFDKGVDYTAFWDEVFGEDNFSEHEIAEMQKYLELQSKCESQPSSSIIAGYDFDDDLPF